MQESFRRLSNELAKVEEGELKAYADKGRVLFMIQNAPDELRRLADALERINIQEIQALVAYQLPKVAEAEVVDGDQKGARGKRTKGSKR